MLGEEIAEQRRDDLGLLEGARVPRERYELEARPRDRLRDAASAQDRYRLVLLAGDDERGCGDAAKLVRHRLARRSFLASFIIHSSMTRLPSGAFRKAAPKRMFST